ncbi:MAG: endonuclease MutS2 [Planctomycetes bacterium]|nr:endonuclease MutS2 [Planctomycetota bacterium]MCB9887856.1 endonuclease MutS2 [Planctomycetota bacterium]
MPKPPDPDRRDESFALDALEYGVVRTLLDERLGTPVGRLAVERLAPYRDLPALQRELAAVAALADKLGPRESLPLGGALEVRWLDGFLRGEHALQSRDLAELKRLVRAGERCRLWFGAGALPLQQFAGAAPQLADLVEELEQIVDDRGEVLDSASPKLAAARREIEQARLVVDTTVVRVLSSAEVRKVLQSPEPAWRHGRPVLQVKAELRHKVAGVMHDRSASGATVFVEPEEVVDAANKLSDLQAREAREIQVVLVDVARALQRLAEPLHAAVDFVAASDLLQAKARLVAEGYTVPEVGAEGPLRLAGGRHPLLLRGPAPEQVVPLELSLGDPHRLLVVTGPNTGGKTVVLKTVGLLSLMALSGVPIPAAVGAQVPFFAAVQADIGDEQGISQNLSTFSSHVQRIARCLRQAGGRALILLDELGAGTDPEEGGVLGYAVLEQLVAAQAYAVVTTHLGRLKDFAYQHDGAENGCMAFDGASLRPLYRLDVGIPGNSHALDIAARVGMPERVVARARELLGPRDQTLDHVIERVQVARRQAEEDRKRTADISRSVAAQKVELDERLAGAVRKENWLQEEADGVVEAELRAAQAALQLPLQGLLSAPGKHGESARALKTVVDGLLKSAALHRRRVRFCHGLKKGAQVFLPRWRRLCVVHKIDKVRETLTVDYGKVRMEVPFEDVSWLQPLGE